MSLDDDAQVLKNIPLFSKVEPTKLKLLAFTSERLNFLAGDALFAEGDTADAAFIILDGEAAVEVRSDGGFVEVARVGRNDIVGEIAILCDIPRTATVRARSDLVALRVSKDGFFHLVTQFPQVGIEIMAELAARLHHTTQALTAARAQLDIGADV
ncbi:MAG: cyclic nucleotide-binding domain-containing protein [Alphaproteobacteria bacterium]|jgi:CRP-like cAMP-binding protein|nr:cyclic nucleotide-binding domain-containing protein [Alphaproteobacteria bacterium]